MSVGIDGGNDFGIRRGLYSQRGTSVKCLLGTQHTGTSVVETGQLERILIGLGSAVDEEQLIVLVATHLAQRMGQFLLQGVLHGVGIESQFGHLAADGLYVVGMGMAHRNHGMASVEVQILLSLPVPHAATLAAFYGDIEKGIYVK